MATVVLIGASTLAIAQPSAKMHRIGWLGAGNPQTDASRSAEEFQQALRDLGYVEGRNVSIEYRYASGSGERLTVLASELARFPVDVIVTVGERAAIAAKGATKTIPIVVTEIGWDPVDAGLVASLGRPEGNVTGFASQSEELWEKRLALLKEFTPKLSRVAVLWNPANPGNAKCVEVLKAAARSTGVQLRPVEVSDAAALDGAPAAVARDAVDALVTCWDSVSLANAKAIADLALKLRLPTLAPLREYVLAGGLMSLGTSLSAQRRRTAHYVDKILKGAKPANLPVERPTQFDLVINLSTAKALGLIPPASFLVLADELIP
jgi:putative ABC transport system substrate-binding protein